MLSTGSWQRMASSLTKRPNRVNSMSIWGGELEVTGYPSHSLRLSQSKKRGGGDA